MNPQSGFDRSALVAEFQRKHRTGLVTLLFTDMVESTKLKQRYGDQEAVALIERHHALVRELLEEEPDGQELETAGDAFLIVFARPSTAVRFALNLVRRVRELARECDRPIADRVGIHLGEVFLRESEGVLTDVSGMQVDICARVTSLGEANQVLMTRLAFDGARQALRGQDLEGTRELVWASHGLYTLKGVEEPIEVCEVYESGLEPPHPPTTSDKAQRFAIADGEPVLGWRPGLGQAVPGTKWVLEEKLGEGGFGEVWVARHQAMKERRVFKFCFRADRVRALKREMTLFRLLKERIGEHPNIVRLLEVSFDSPPYYVEMDHVEAQDLRAWCERQGGIKAAPLAAKLEIVAQMADALQAAHDAGVIHRDVKPANILVRSEAQRGALEGSPATSSSGLLVKLTDFGIGQVVSDEYLAGVTRAGFTQTMMSSGQGTLTGTQMYMAPELVAGKAASPRSDIYSLGVVLYQLLMDDWQQPVTTDWADNVPDPLLRDDLKHCFAGNPQERFGGAGQLAHRLRTLEQRRAALAAEQAALAERERKAYRRGVVRTAALAAVFVAVVLALAVNSIRASLRALTGEAAARKSLYAADMNLAQQALDMNNLGRARALIDRHRPQPGQKDLRGWEWRYLWRRCQSDALSTLTEHTNSILGVTFAADGGLLAFGGSDGELEWWDVLKRKRIAAIHEPPDAVVLAASPDGKVVAASMTNGLVRFWQTSGLEPPRRLEPALPHKAPVNSLVFSPDGQYVATYPRDGTVTVWDWRQALLLKQYKAPTSGGGAYQGVVRFSPDSELLAIGQANGRVRLVEWRSGKERLQFTNDPGAIVSLTFSPDGSQVLAACGFSATPVRVWETATGRLAASLTGHKGWVRWLIFTDNGSILISVSADQTIRVWDASTWDCLRVIRGHLDEIHAAALAPNGRLLATGGKDGTVLLWNVRSAPADDPLVVLPGNTTAWVCTKDGKTLFTILNGSVVRRPMAALDRTEVIEALVRTNTTLALSPDERLLAAGDRDGQVKIFDLVRQQILTDFTAHTGPVQTAAFLPFGHGLATRGKTDNSLRLWNTNRWSQHRAWTNPMPLFRGVMFPREMLWVGSDDAHVHVWNLTNGHELMGLYGHIQTVDGIDISPSGRVLATGGHDGKVKLWSLATGKELTTLRGHLLGVHSIAFSPDGTRLVTGSNDREAVKIWDANTMQELATLEGQGFMFRLLGFAPGQNALLAANVAGRLYIWRAPSMEQIEQTEQSRRK